jgi:Tol biopolymer transport system component
MKNKDIERAIRKICITKTQAETTDAEMDKQTLSDALAAYDNSKNLKSMIFKTDIWRVIMKSPITKITSAAVVALAILLPLSYGAAKLIKRFITISQMPAIKVDFPSGYDGALSPDGRYLAGNTWNSELIVIDTSTGEQRKLAENCYGSVVWSTDVNEIAVVRSGQEQEKDVLLAVSSITSKTRTLMEDPPLLQDWSPNGRFILGIRKPAVNAYSTVMVNLRNKEETVLAEETENRPSPRFSPNGHLASYVTKQNDQSVLHLRRIDGTNDVKFAEFPGEISKPIWAPDGTHVIFTGTQKGIDRQHKDLWALRVEGDRFVGAPFPVVPDVEQMEFYNWSRNGQLAYRTSFELGGMFTLPMDLQTGKATGAPRQLVRRAGFSANHCWSPDGKQIALRKEGELIFISASNGEKIRILPLPGTRGDLGYYGRGMSWSPDGKWIAFSGFDKEKNAGIFLATLETGDVRPLVLLDEKLAHFDPTWAPDSKTIAYAYKGDVYVVDVEDGKSRRITAPEEREHKRAGRPVFAPDGRSVAYIVGQRILATTIDGQETREIFHLKNKKIWGINIFSWSPDGRHIVFTPGNNEIYCVPTDGGEPYQIADLSNLGDHAWAWMPKWSPTGDTISFTVSHEKYQYWVMTDLLPTAELDGQK